MSGSSTPAADEATEKLILDVFRERHRHDLSLRDDVFRTLPFFATALGVVIAAVGAITSCLPPLEQIGRSRLLVAAVIATVRPFAALPDILLRALQVNRSANE